MRIIKSSSRPRDNITRGGRQSLRTLKNNTALTIIPATKAMLPWFSTLWTTNRRLPLFLRIHHIEDWPLILLIWHNEKPHYGLKKSTLTKDTCKHLCPAGSRPPRLYGLLKIHKEGVPLRPIVSNIGAPTYQLSKYLAGILSQLTGNSAHHVKNSLLFIQILECLRVQPEDLMVSFNMLSLFTNFPTVDSLELLSHHFEDYVQALFQHVLTSKYLCFDGQFYEQTGGIAMGSPLSTVIPNFFMENFEKKAIEQATHKPVCWCRYVEDTVVIWPHGQRKLTVSEPPQWTPQQDTVYNGKRRRPTSIPGHWHLQINKQLPRAQSISEIHPYQFLPTQNLHQHPANKHSVLASLIHTARALCDQYSLTQELEFLTTVFKDSGYIQPSTDTTSHGTSNMDRQGRW